MKKYVSFFLVSLLAMILTACNSDKTNETTNEIKTDDAKKLAVYTTVYPLQYFSERIGGDLVNVQSIYPPGANEHTFEPTQKDMMKLADADVFFYIGLGLEGFVDTAKETLKNEDVQLVAVAEDISEDKFAISTGHTHAEAVEEDAHANETPEEHAAHTEDAHANETADEHAAHATEGDTHENHAHDTHVWLSPTLSQDLALAIKNTLIEKLPEQKDSLEANYEQLVTELNDLNSKFENMAANTKSKTFFVSHAAFGYIAGQYGFTQVPVAGLNSQSEPSQKELAAIVDLAKKENIQYIFFEQNVSSNLTKVIQNEVGAKSLTLHNLGVLTDEDIKNKETYFTLMEKNIEALQTALQ